MARKILDLQTVSKYDGAANAQRQRNTMAVDLAMKLQDTFLHAREQDREQLARTATLAWVSVHQSIRSFDKRKREMVDACRMTMEEVGADDRSSPGRWPSWTASAQTPLPTLSA